jgi:hypothetical protein
VGHGASAGRAQHAIVDGTGTNAGTAEVALSASRAVSTAERSETPLIRPELTQLESI